MYVVSNNNKKKDQREMKLIIHVLVLLIYRVHIINEYTWYENTVPFKIQTVINMTVVLFFALHSDNTITWEHDVNNL